MPNPMCTVFPTVTRYTQNSNLLSFTFAWLTEWSKKLPPTLPFFLSCFCWVSTSQLSYYCQLFVPICILWRAHQIKLFRNPVFTNLFHQSCVLFAEKKKCLVKWNICFLFQLLEMWNIGVQNCPLHLFELKYLRVSSNQTF